MASLPVPDISNVQHDSELNNYWDPTRIDNNIEVISQCILKRIINEIFACVKLAESHHIYVVPDSENILIVHTIIVGPGNTPYDGGFFYFIVKFPGNYPMSPPKVKLMNTDQNSVRFNPYLFQNGMICLSILGTYHEPSWSPSNTLFDVLLSIQSIMCANPFYTSTSYAHYIRHETLRVAVVNILKEDNSDTRRMPSILRNSAIEVFKLKTPAYFRTISEYSYLDTNELHDPLNWDATGLYNYQSLKISLAELAKKHLTDPVTIAYISTHYNINFGENNNVDSECSELSDAE